MSKQTTDLVLESHLVNSQAISLFLTLAKVENTIHENDSSLIFISYPSSEFDETNINPALSIYCDDESKFLKFLLISPAPALVNKNNIDAFIESLNNNYVVTNYEFSESDDCFYIMGEYWLNFKFGLKCLELLHIISALPSILNSAFESELSKLKLG